MPEDVVKQSTIRLPVTITRGAQRGARWSATVTTGDHGGFNPFSCDATSQAAARQALADLVTDAFTRLQHRPVLVIGGEGQYSGHVHLINPEPQGWVVYAIRDGHCAASWHGDYTRDSALEEVRRHVGGQPALVSL